MDEWESRASVEGDRGMETSGGPGEQSRGSCEAVCVARCVARCVALSSGVCSAVCSAEPVVSL